MAPGFPFRLDVHPDQPLEDWRLSLPGKGACYLLCDGRDQPILLATVGSLRQAVVHRLTHPDADQPTKRIDYRAVVRRIDWRPVFSRFEGHWAYLEYARQLYPQDYRPLVRQWQAHWVNVQPDAEHPRFAAAKQPAAEGAVTVGPIGDATAARRYIELLQDLFDLCRYHEVLQQAPHGQACAYKEMGKCPAPCDGSVAMAAYRQQIAEAVAFATQSHAQWVAGQTDRMMHAAAQTQFEQAAAIKAGIDKAAAAEAAAYRHMRPLEDFRYLLLERGDGKRKVRPFILAPGRIEFAGEMQPKAMGDQIAYLRAEAQRVWDAPRVAMDQAAVERTNLAAWHLLREERDRGLFLHAEQCTAERIAEAIEQMREAKETGATRPDAFT